MAGEAPSEDAAKAAKQDQQEGAEGADGDGRKRAKRKMALVVGFIGTRYRGLMINYELDPSPLAADEEVKDKQSVEAAVRTALVRASAITPVNAERLEQKISWSRSSRTDAGVHAVRLVLCAKLLVFPDNIDEEGFCEPLVADVNKHLPDDVRCFSAARVPNNFDAKHVCSWREYEYVLPTKLVFQGSEELPAAAAAKRLEDVMRKFEGHHSFHNFTRLKLSNVTPKPSAADGDDGKGKKGKGKGRGKKRKAAEAGLEENVALSVEAAEDGGACGENEGDQDEGAQNQAAPPSSENKDGSSAGADGKPWQDPLWVAVCNRDADLGQWRTRPAQVMKHTQSTIHLASVDASENGALLRVRLRGQFFLYNQIRLMVGAAVAVCAGHLPEELLLMALMLQIEMSMPLAPPTGLLLRTAGFHEMDLRMGHCAMDAEQAQECMLPVGGFLLVSKAGTERVAQFARQIEQEIHRRWQDAGVVDAWEAKLQRIRVPAGDDLAELREQASKAKEAEDRAKAQQLDADNKRRELDLNAGCGTTNSLLPRRFASNLMVRFRIPPGWKVLHIQNALVSRLRQWHKQPDQRPSSIVSGVPGTQELLDYVASVGVDSLADAGDS